MDLEFMVLDTFDNLRPALIKFQTPEEADKTCDFIGQREAASLDIQDVLGSYQKDGGGYEFYYDESHYYDEYYNYGEEEYPEEE